MNAEILIIGDEILIGQTTDTNSTWIASQLNHIGIEIIRITTIKDQSEAIHKALASAEKSADIIIMTGGLGPTKDDITKASLASYFGVKMARDSDALENIRKMFEKRNVPMLRINEDQAIIPVNCIPIPNKKGTAPGMYFEERGKVFVSLPGVPYEMKWMMSEFVLHKLSALLSKLTIVHKTITVIDIPESILSTQIETVEDNLPNDLKMAYLPHLNIVRLRISGRSSSKSIQELSEAIDKEFDRIKAIIGDVWYDGNKNLSEIVGELLIQQKQTIGTVESCTGGFIAHSISKTPGCSSYYQGSLLTYSNRLKIEKLGVKPEIIQTKGAVSTEVAEQMARAGKEQLKLDYCISTTGIAGPTGATDIKPVGLVFIGLALADGEVLVLQKNFHGTREQVIERTANTALNWLRTILEANIRNQNAQKPAQQ